MMACYRWRKITRTNNDSENAPMLVINPKLGDQPLPSIDQLVKQIDPHSKHKQSLHH